MTFTHTLRALALAGGSLTAAHAQTLVLHPSLNAIGVEVKLANGYDTDKTATCTVRYKAATATTWLEGFAPDRITLEAQDEFRGSLFNLNETTTYIVEVTLRDTTPTVATVTLPPQTTTTRTSIIVSATGTIKWVSPTGVGTAYTQANPGSIVTLFNSPITCGTTVMVMHGTYDAPSLQLNLTTDCTASTPITIMAAPGATPVFEGGSTAPLTWQQNANDPKLYSAALPSGFGYTNLCLLDTFMLYPYASVAPNVLLQTYSLSALDLNYDGFVRDGATIFIKTAAGTNPNTRTITLSKANRFLTIYGNNKKAYLRLKGLTIKDYCKTSVSGTTAYPAIACDFRDVHQVVFDACTFAYNNFHLTFTNGSNDVTLQHCTFKDQTGLWSHGMIKKSVSDQFVLYPESVGRQFENAAIVFGANGSSSSNRIILKDNHFIGTGSGVVGGSDTGIYTEIDITDNTFINNFDATETDGNWCNLRIFHNTIRGAMAAFSMAPPNLGPRYIYRNVVHQTPSRRNLSTDPYYIGCQTPTTYTSQGLGIKTNIGATPSPTAANLYFINNTFHTADTLGFVQYQWDNEWKKFTAINNIYYSASKNLFFLTNASGNTDYQYASDHDNYFITTPQPLWRIKEVHGGYICHNIYTATDLQTSLRTYTGSTQVNITAPLQRNPSFVSASTYNFSLNPNSPMINAGVPVKGFYDYIGSSPDIGAIESQVVATTQTDTPIDHLTVYPNPSHGTFTIAAPSPLHTIVIYTLLGQRLATYTFSQQQTNETIDIATHTGAHIIIATTTNGKQYRKIIIIE